MGRSRFVIDRRSFLATATPFALWLPSLARAQTVMERGRFDDEQLPLAREQLLQILNAERVSAGLNQLQLDDLASQIAQEHARDMATGGFINHFGTNGRKPYQRIAWPAAPPRCKRTLRLRKTLNQSRRYACSVTCTTCTIRWQKKSAKRRPP